jgi:hypothetical protein
LLLEAQMLGKRNRRAQAFSTCHAVLLAAFIVLAQLLGLGASDHGFQVSGQDVIDPLGATPVYGCGEGSDSVGQVEPCTLLLRATQDTSGSVGIVIWQFGARL